MERFNYDGDREIDLKQLVSLLWKKIYKILLAGLIMAWVLISIRAITTISTMNGKGSYLGVAKIFIAKDVPNTTSAAIRSYFMSNNLLNSVISNLNLDLTYKDLSSMINLDDSSTTLIVVKVTGNDQNLIQSITDYLAVSGLAQIKNNFKYNSAFIIEPAFTTIDTRLGWIGFTKGLIKYAALGFLLGSVMLAGFYAFLFIHDSSIRNEDDVNNYLNVPVLGVIPTIEGTYKNSGRLFRRRQ